MKEVKDGGAKSTVWAHWFIESKLFGSIGLLRFEDGSREAYHSHAFNSWSWLLTGALDEQVLGGNLRRWLPSWRPIETLRSTFHRVTSHGRSWVLTVRGPWAEKWHEWRPYQPPYDHKGQLVELRDGRAEAALATVAEPRDALFAAGS